MTQSKNSSLFLSSEILSTTLCCEPVFTITLKHHLFPVMSHAISNVQNTLFFIRSVGTILFHFTHVNCFQLMQAIFSRLFLVFSGHPDEMSRASIHTTYLHMYYYCRCNSSKLKAQHVFTNLFT